MSDGEGTLAVAGALFLAGPATGIAIYTSIKRKYRNMAARYRPDQVVNYRVLNLIENDTFLRTFKSRSSQITGRNDSTTHVRAKHAKAFKH